MDAQAHKELARRISEEIDTIEKSIPALEQALQPRESDCGIGRMVSADAVPGRNTAEEALRLASERLRKLKVARGRVDSPGFGVCQVCHTPIPMERLLLVPEASTCTSCKSVSLT